MSVVTWLQIFDELLTNYKFVRSKVVQNEVLFDSKHSQKVPKRTYVVNIGKNIT